MKLSRFTDRFATSSWSIALLLLAVVLTYGHTIDVPFYLDDHSSIVENPVIQRGDLGEILQFSTARAVGYLTFVANYRYDALDPAGYHLVNITIHLLVALTVWGIARALVRAPAIGPTLVPQTVNWLPLLAALLFLLHPLHTGAVTYIVQRLASLTALGYLLAILAYARLRLATRLPLAAGWLLLLLAGAAIALMTKQNSATLPLAIWLVELIAFSRNRRRFLLWSGVGLLLLAALWALLAFHFRVPWLTLEYLDSQTRETSQFGRDLYLYTQFDVLWRYLGHFFYPFGLHLDRHVELASALFEWRTLVALAGHLLLISASLLLIRRQPLVTLGVALWYTAHAVESGIFPIRDLMFEHRTYLPDAGLVLAVTALLMWGGRRVPPRLLAAVVVALLLLLAVVTWQRNDQWRDPERFWLDNTVQSPLRQRPFIELGKSYLKQNRNQEAVHALTTASRLDNDQPVYSPALPINLSIALRRVGRTDEAREVIENGLRFITDGLNRGKLQAALAMIHASQGEIDQAEGLFRAALESYPYLTNVMFNLALIEAQRGRLNEAESLLVRALAIDPDHSNAIELLQKIRQLKVGGSS